MTYRVFIVLLVVFIGVFVAFTSRFVAKDTMSMEALYLDLLLERNELLGERKSGVWLSSDYENRDWIPLDWAETMFKKALTASESDTKRNEGVAGTEPLLSDQEERLISIASQHRITGELISNPSEWWDNLLYTSEINFYRKSAFLLSKIGKQRRIVEQVPTLPAGWEPDLSQVYISTAGVMDWSAKYYEYKYFVFDVETLEWDKSEQHWQMTGIWIEPDARGRFTFLFISPCEFYGYWDTMEGSPSKYEPEWSGKWDGRCQTE